MGFGADLGELLLRIKSDPSQGIDGVREFRGAVGSLKAEATELGDTFEGAGRGIRNFGSGLVAIAAPAAAVVAGVTAAAVAVYSLTSAVAESDGKFKDLSQQLGISVETLSALDNAAATSGGSINTISGSLFIFQKNMEAAKDSGSEMGQTFTRLGITTTNTEKAFAQALVALAALNNEQEKTALAAQIFGRSARDVLGILRESGGDIDVLKQKFADLGLLVTTDMANAADAFSDQQIEMQRQLQATTREFAEEFYPVVIDVMKGTTEALRDNKDNIEFWSAAAAAAAKDTANWSFEINHFLAVTNPFTLWLDFAVTGIRAYIAATNEAQGATLGFARSFSALPTNLGKPEWSKEFGLPEVKVGGGGGGGRRGGGGGGRNKALEEFLQASKEAQREQERIFGEETATLDRELGRRIISLEDYTRQAKDIRTQEYNEFIDRINDQILAIEKSNIKRAEKDKKLAAIDRQTAARTAEYNREIQRLEDEKNEAIEQAGLAHRRRMLALHDSQRDREIDKIRELMEFGAVTTGEGLERIEQLTEDSYNERQRIYTLEIELAGQNAQRLQEINDRKAQSDEEYTRRIEENTRRRIEAHQREAVMLSPEGVPIQGSTTVSTPSQRGAEIIAEIGEAPPNFDPWHAAFGLLKQSGVQAFGSIAGAAQAFLASGKAGESAIKSLVRSIVASLAVQAGVEAAMQVAHAIKETALASASLAVFDVRGAAMHSAAASAHWTAAAAFGVIGGGAAIAALALGGGQGGASAGGAIQSAGQSAFGGGRGTGGTPYSGLNSPENPYLIEQGRNQQPPIVLRLELDTNGVINVVQSNVRSNGEMRNVIIETVNAVS